MACWSFCHDHLFPESNAGMTWLKKFPLHSHVDNTELAVQDVLMQELMSLEPVAFHKVAVDIDSLHLNRKSWASAMQDVVPFMTSSEGG